MSHTARSTLPGQAASPGSALIRLIFTLALQHGGLCAAGVDSTISRRFLFEKEAVEPR
jgi:hypothetical protein